MEELVSIITPCYNSAAFVGEAINSVISQTYTNWEMILIDDVSKDNTADIIKNYCQSDPRIRFFQLEQNSGSAAHPRNRGIREAKGRFIAFLDSDDVWLPDKLSRQLELFQQEQVAIVYSDYEKMKENGKRNHRLIKAPQVTDYRQLLKGNTIGCLTAIYDTAKVGKIYFQPIGHEDYVLWLEILREGFIAVNCNCITALYRVRDTSLSSNKIKALGWTWNIFRHVEKLNFFQSSYCFLHYAIKSCIKFFI